MYVCKDMSGNGSGGERELEGRLWLLGRKRAIGVFRDNQPFVTEELDLIRSGQRFRWVLGRAACITILLGSSDLFRKPEISPHPFLCE